MEHNHEIVSTAVTLAPPRVTPAIRALQTITALLFIFEVLWSLFGPALLFNSGSSPETVGTVNSLVLYGYYAFWIIPFIIASNKQIRIAVALFCLSGIVINHFIPSLCDVAGCTATVGAGVTVLIFALTVSYIISILALNAGEDNPVHKWLVILLTILLMRYIVNLFVVNMFVDLGGYIQQIYVNTPITLFNIVVNLYMIIVFWQVFHSSLFSGYNSDISCCPLLPSANVWMLKGIAVAAFSILSVFVWYSIIGKSLI